MLLASAMIMLALSLARAVAVVPSLCGEHAVQCACAEGTFVDGVEKIFSGGVEVDAAGPTTTGGGTRAGATSRSAATATATSTTTSHLRLHLAASTSDPPQGGDQCVDAHKLLFTGWEEGSAWRRCEITTGWWPVWPVAICTPWRARLVGVHIHAVHGRHVCDGRMAHRAPPPPLARAAPLGHPQVGALGAGVLPPLPHPVARRPRHADDAPAPQEDAHLQRARRGRRRPSRRSAPQRARSARLRLARRRRTTPSTRCSTSPPRRRRRPPSSPLPHGAASCRSTPRPNAGRPRWSELCAVLSVCVRRAGR